MTNLQPPAHSESVKVAFPVPHVLLLSFNRPSALNAMSQAMHADMKAMLDWFEDEPELWVAVLTGEGRLFCAGADLKEWNKDEQAGRSTNRQRIADNKDGFGSVSRRQSNKPIIAAVNGGAYGGGMEIVVNCDLVVTEEHAKFGFTEVSRGVVVTQGAIPRLIRIAGHQRASELLLTGKIIGAAEARDRFGFVNIVIPNSSKSVVAEAIKLAQEITANSPDAVQAAKHGLVLAQNLQHKEAVLAHVWSRLCERLYEGRNIKEGLEAFAAKRAPVWTNPAKL